MGQRRTVAAGGERRQERPEHAGRSSALYVDGWLVETKVVAKKIKVNKCVLKL